MDGGTPPPSSKPIADEPSSVLTFDGIPQQSSSSKSVVDQPSSSSKSITNEPSSVLTFEGVSSLDDGSTQESAFAALPDLASPWSDQAEQRLLLEIQQLVDRFNDCFQCLESTLIEADELREENSSLSAHNLELSLLIADLESSAAAPPPKSIGIRSTEYITAKQLQPHRFRVEAGAAAEDGGKSSTAEKDEDAAGGVEVEAYRQGAVKTELCNKWDEMTGWCPYGDLCRFSHGVEELRPVLRHPRYKTQLCRMLDVPGGCPYGHRCHFRHAGGGDRCGSSLTGTSLY